MSPSLSRREFLKVGSLALGAWVPGMAPRADPVDEPGTPVGIGRVTVEMIRPYSQPSFSGQRGRWIKRDRLLPLLEEVQSPDGPTHNPTWYRVRQGYVHSGYLQRVEGQHLNWVAESIPEGGGVGEVTVPYVRTYRFIRGSGWEPLYRLYYQSVHRIVGIDEGPGQLALYRLYDDLLNVEYHAPATALRLVPPAEFSPISSEVPPDEKMIVVSVADQSLTAYEGEKIILQTSISSGVPDANPEDGEVPTDTPLGSFRIQTKVPGRHMGDGHLTSDILAYELPGVPWTMIFQKDGIALHGAYWHNHFGIRMSHGCVNMRIEDARWTLVQVV
jgi:hypothetical protein